MKSIAKKILSKLPDVVNTTKKQNEIDKETNNRSEYVALLYKYLLERKPIQTELDYWLNSSYSYLKIFRSFIKLEEYRNKQNPALLQPILISLCKAHIVGEDKPLGIDRIIVWYKTVAEELINQQIKPEQTRQEIITAIDNENTVKNHFASLSHPTLTIITSLYKGEKYIKFFLENITNQTIFNQCQLFIVDANSPENEHKTIKQYLEEYPNIEYIRLDETIGIYEAWNLVIKESRSEFLTNANVDDLHRSDALELKVKALQENPEIDVVYSDVYYSFIANVSFEIAEKGGIRTNLPNANKFNLLNFNSPHNSPIWRRSLHEKIGYFDITYKSAGDHEFWLRAAFSGAAFMKISEPVVVYYQNPEGISTQQDSPGNIEGPQTVKRYRSLLEL